MRCENLFPIESIIYGDESGDEKFFVFSGLAIPAEHWQSAFEQIRKFRHDLSLSDGIPVTTEFHAWKFVSGRGDLGERIVTKQRRNVIFRNTLEMITAIPNVRLYNAVFPAGQTENAFESLLAGINLSMLTVDNHALMVFDEGKETMYTRLARKRQVYNPKAEEFTGAEPPVNQTTPTERILEDPFYKKSDQSYFTQMADFCSYALLRRESPLASRKRYDLHTAFALLQSVLALDANLKDVEGIIRP